MEALNRAILLREAISAITFFPAEFVLSSVVPPPPLRAHCNFGPLTFGMAPHCLAVVGLSLPLHIPQTLFRSDPPPTHTLLEIFIGK